MPPASVTADSTSSSTSGQLAARRQQVVHHAGRLGIPERAQLDGGVTVAAAAPPAVAPGQHLRARQADDQHRPAQALDEVRQQLEGVVLRPLHVVEHQDERLGALVRVGLQEALDDGPPHRPDLLRVALDGLDERRVLEAELEQLPQEVGDVADLAVLEHGRELRPHLGLGGLGIHAFDRAEPGPEHAREDLVRRAALARRALELRPAGRSRCRIAPMRTNEEVANQTRLADAGGAHHGDGPRLLLVAHRGIGALELAHLGRAAGQRRAALGGGEPRRGKKAVLGHAHAEDPPYFQCVDVWRPLGKPGRPDASPTWARRGAARPWSRAWEARAVNLARRAQPHVIWLGRCAPLHVLPSPHSPRR